MWFFLKNPSVVRLCKLGYFFIRVFVYSCPLYCSWQVINWGLNTEAENNKYCCFYISFYDHTFNVWVDINGVIEIL